MLESPHKLAHLLFGEDGRSAYTHSIAWDFPPTPNEPLKPNLRAMPFLIYASMAAMETNLKQLTAGRLGKLGRMCLWPQNIDLNLPKQLRYHHWTAPLTGEYHHVIVTHPAALASTVTPFATFYLIRPLQETGIPETAPTAFFEFLNRTTTIPMKSSWTSFLWETLKADHGISVCPGHDATVLRCAVQPALLLTRIQTALRAGRIH